jgi:hypothetical protein
MSEWDWIHAGLEVMTYTQVLKAQSTLAEMKKAGDIEAARRRLLEAMKSFIFDISRDIQLVEPEIASYPQQVYIVSKSLEHRFTNSGLSADVFPDFQDKEYVFQMQNKISEVIDKSKQSLTQDQIEESDKAVKYVSEISLLQEAIPAKSAQVSLMATEEEWRKLDSRKTKKNLFIIIGVIGLLMFYSVGCYVLLAGFVMLAEGGIKAFIAIAIILGIFTFLIGGSIGLIVFGAKFGSNPNYWPLKAKRDNWRRQLMSRGGWQEVVSTFGDLPSEQYQIIYDEHVSFLQPLLGSDFQKYLTAS